MRNLAECYQLAIARADAEKEITDRDLLSIYHQVRRAHAPEHAGAAPKTSTVR